MNKLCGLVFVATLYTAGCQAQTSGSQGFVELFNGRTLNGWTVDDGQYADHFSVREGLLHIEGEGGWLRSVNQYDDFTLRMEFRYLTEDPGGGRVGVSGVFLRTPAEATTTAESPFGASWPDNSLEVQLANRQGGRPAIPGDARWGGAILRHGNPGGPTSFDTDLALQSYGQTGDWQTLEIQAIGDAIHVTLNGNYLGYGSAGGNARGYIGLQAETGAIEFRSIQINEGNQNLVATNMDGFVPLFDGQTLNGWKKQNPDSAGFDVVDGAIVVRGRSAAADSTAPTCNGSIWTEQAYGDFTLRYQARFETNGSVGGFFLRSPEPGMQGGWNQIETRAMQDKLLPWNGILMRAAGGHQGYTVFDYRAAELAYTATPDWTKDWVNYEVQAKGGRITSWVNGVLVGKAEDVQPLEGIFGLQCERETVEYRNIYIREE